MMNEQNFSEKLSLVLEQGSDLNRLGLADLLENIPTINKLEHMPVGSPVLLRLDLDVPLKGNLVADESRLHSALQTLDYCRDRKWRTIVIGHLGREDGASLSPVRAALEDLINQPIDFIDDWITQDSKGPFASREVSRQLKGSKPGSVMMFENLRHHQFERALWRTPLPVESSMLHFLHRLGMSIAGSFASVEINDAIAASNHDFSSTVLPLFMEKNAMGFHLAEEFRTHVQVARTADFIVFSGLKANKLDDLESVIGRGGIRLVLAAGSLAMALRKAEAAIDGTQFSIGKAETDSDIKSYISEARIEQGVRIVKLCRDQGVTLVLPVDFVLDNGEVADIIPPDRTQMDIGPRSRELFLDASKQYVELTRAGEAEGVLYYNGVFGRFEDELFSGGTRSFVSQLKHLTKAGVKTFVGGGEGRLALSKYGDLSDVTHAFTCGGTILKSLTDQHVGYLKAMYLASCSNSN